MESTTKRRKPRVPMSEQIKLINECRRSGLTDADWCREHQIPPSTFYTWIKRCRKAAQGEQLIEPRYGHSIEAQPKQDVVPVSIVQEQIPEEKQLPSISKATLHLDNSHTIEVVMNDVIIRINNDVNPDILGKTLRILKEVKC